MIKKIISICPFCGCGCKLGYKVEADKIIGIEPVPDDPVSNGKPCIKGLSAHQSAGLERITTPMLRKNKSQPLVPCTFGEAYQYIYEKTKDLAPQEIFLTGSGEHTLEDNFLMQKFARIVFRTNNIDCCARLCHAPTAWAFNKIIGQTAMPSVMDDILDRDLILVVGSNPATNYPVHFQRFLKAKADGAKIVTCEAAPNETSKISNLHLNINPSSIVVFLGGLIREVGERTKEKFHNSEGFAGLLESVAGVDENYVLEKCGVSKEAWEKLVALVLASQRFAIAFGMGLTQHKNGTQNAMAAIQLGFLKEGKVIPMRGKINVQGAGDMQACPGGAPFGGSVSLAREIWGHDLPEGEGLKVTESLLEKPVKAVFIMGMNPAQSLPNLNLVHKNLQNMFVIYLHHHPSVTMEFADVVLPGAILYEKEGTIANSERRVRYVQKVSDSPAGKADWEIICELAKVFGFEKEFTYKDASEVFLEITKSIPEYAGLVWENVKENEVFADKEAKFLKFFPLEIPKISKDPEYPFILTSARLLQHFCTGELTLRSQRLKNLAPEAFCQISQEDAQELGLSSTEQERTVIIKSRAGEIEVKVQISPGVPPKVLVVPFHFEKVLVNKLALGDLDPVVGIPNFKAIPVKVEL